MIGRELVCNSCLEILEVFEAPEGWIDPELYRCGRCMDAPPVDAQRTLALEPVSRRETPKYDPAQSRIPF